MVHNLVHQKLRDHMIQFVFFIRVKFPCFKASSNMPTKLATRNYMWLCSLNPQKILPNNRLICMHIEPIFFENHLSFTSNSCKLIPFFYDNNLFCGKQIFLDQL